MIFVTVGSQKFQFNRLLETIDHFAETGEIIFAQTGYSDYQPKNYEYKAFLNREEFIHEIDQSDIVITHGGTGAIVSALKKGKKVIAVPRLAKYGEHVDDHQLQIVNEFVKTGFILSCQDCDELYNMISEIKNMDFPKFISNTQAYIDSINRFINNE